MKILVTKGFTLIEALIAISILTMVIASTMGIVQTSLSSNSFSQAQVTANYLAGEAIEYIRNIRDTNFITDNADWLNAIPADCISANGCDVDTINNSFITCSATCDPLRITKSTTGGFYHHNTLSGANSQFTRTIHIENINTNEISIEVTITSNSGFFKKTPLIVVEHLFKWSS